MNPPTADRPHPYADPWPGPPPTARRTRPRLSARIRHRALTVLIVLLTLVCGAAPAAAAAPGTSAPPALAVPEPHLVEAEERTAGDGKAPDPPHHALRARAHAPAAGGRALTRPCSVSAPPPEPAASRGPAGPREAAGEPVRSGAELLVLHCVARS
ncbi:hypothetical protein RB200_29485 [Streptomyces sp. PmtG]